MPLLKDAEQRPAIGCLQAAERLIQQQHPGPGQQHPGQGHPLNLMREEGLGSAQADLAIECLTFQQLFERQRFQALPQGLVSEQGIRQQQVFPQAARQDTSGLRQVDDRLT